MTCGQVVSTRRKRGQYILDKFSRQAFLHFFQPIFQQILCLVEHLPEGLGET